MQAYVDNVMIRVYMIVIYQSVADKLLIYKHINTQPKTVGTR